MAVTIGCQGLKGVVMEEIAIGIRDAAKAVGLSVWTLRGWIRQGKLRCVRLGRRVMLEPGALRNLVEQGRSVGDSNVYDLRKLGDHSEEVAKQ
jgi:excisionase family DNA binding protein